MDSTRTYKFKNQVMYFLKTSLLMFVVFICSCFGSSTNNEDDGISSFRVMTFNLWHGGDAAKLPRPTTIKAQLDAIRTAGADVVGLQEQTSGQSDQSSRAMILADSLGWHCHIVDGSRAIISRFSVEVIESAEGKHAQAVLVDLGNNKKVIFGVMHLMYTPYEPYDIADRKLKTATEAEQSARETRLHQLEAMLADISSLRQSGIPAILVGDFNEPSCLDWTAQAIADRNDPALPFPVNWPATAKLLEEGFTDAYRNIYPDVHAKPGYTWTSVPGLFRDPEVLDRIDLIYHTAKLKTKETWMIGEKADDVDIKIDPWPSDHRAVVTELVWED